MPGSRPKTPVGKPVISTWLRFGTFSVDVGCCWIVHSARPSPTFARSATTKVQPLGALPLCTARTLAENEFAPYDRPSNHDSTHIVKVYSSPSARPGKVAVAPSAEVWQRFPSCTMPYRSDEPSPLSAAEARAVTVEVPSPIDSELRARFGLSGAPMPLPHTVVAAPEALPPRPGGRVKREYGVIVMGEEEFVPMRYEPTSAVSCPGRSGTRTVSPLGLVISIPPVCPVSSPEIDSETTPPSPLVTTGATTTVAGAPGAAYAHATVLTRERDSPTELTAAASYVRCSPLGAAIGGHEPSAEQRATSW